MFSTDDTIVAIATPPGRAGLGVVRIAGPAARDVAAALVPGPPLAPRHASVRRLADAGAEAVIDAETRGVAPAAIDQVVATLFAAPASYTGDDVVEIAAHGSPVLLDAIVRRAIASGARLAAPGEFTLRAFLNGKLDLVQAEAVADLIDAVTPAQARLAFDQLDGTLSHALAAIGEALFDLRVKLEASLDFPDEGYHFIEPGAVASGCEAVRAQVTALLATARRGRLLREGCRVAIVGRPNVGKSQLFNALLGAGRAIVTPHAGTTRDLLTERCEIGGLAVTLVDTAGVRESAEAIEQEGIARARQAADTADVRVVVLDRSVPLDPLELPEASASARPIVIVANKSDLAPAWSASGGSSGASSGGSSGASSGGPSGGPSGAIAVSALTGAGLDDLRQAIADAALAHEPLSDTPAIANVRHVALLERVEARLREAAAQAAAAQGEEIVLATLQDAFAALDEIVGKRSSDDVLREIFARFCIGK